MYKNRQHVYSAPRRLTIICKYIIVNVLHMSFAKLFTNDKCFGIAANKRTADFTGG